MISLTLQAPRINISKKKDWNYFLYKHTEGGVFMMKGQQKKAEAIFFLLLFPKQYVVVSCLY